MHACSACDARAARSYPRRRDRGRVSPDADDHGRPRPSGAPSHQLTLQRRADRKPKCAQQAQRVGQLAADGKSVRRFATLRVESRTPGERVPKDCHVRRQLRAPRGFPFSPYLVRCRTKQRTRVPKLRRLHAPPLKSGHAQSPSSHYQISKHPDELGLDCAKTQAEGEQKLDRFWAHAVARYIANALVPTREPRRLRSAQQILIASSITMVIPRASAALKQSSPIPDVRLRSC